MVKYNKGISEKDMQPEVHREIYKELDAKMDRIADLVKTSTEETQKSMTIIAKAMTDMSARDKHYDETFNRAFSELKEVETKTNNNANDIAELKTDSLYGKMAFRILTWGGGIVGTIVITAILGLVVINNANTANQANQLRQHLEQPK